jgi:hypothetical protein
MCAAKRLLPWRSKHQSVRNTNQIKLEEHLAQFKQKVNAKQSIQSRLSIMRAQIMIKLWFANLLQLC